MQLILPLESISGLPLYKQLADAIGKAIKEGTLSPGQVLPSSRELAESMSVSRLTASRCYMELSSQGYIKTCSRGKTFVKNDTPVEAVPLPSPKNKRTFKLSQFGERLLYLHETSAAAEADLSNCGATPIKDLPTSRWKECLQESLRVIVDQSILSDRDSFGSMRLREQLRALIFRTRAINCSAEQIIIFPSTEGGFDLLCRVMLSENDLVATEDPSSAWIRRSLQMNGARVVAVPLDDEGIKIDTLKDLKESPRMVYVTPSHQDTKSMTMSRMRRHRLLQWAISTGALIVEDDIDSEFRYGEEPQAALLSQDMSGTVIYRYNFWKLLYPLVRLSFMVIPSSLIPVFRNALNTFRADIPLLEQEALAIFINKGHYERHAQKCRRLYTTRRAALIHALSKIMGNKINIQRQTGGTHLIARFASSMSENKLLSAAQDAGIFLCSSQANYSTAERPSNEFLIPFTNIDEINIDSQIEDFMSCTGQDELSKGVSPFEIKPELKNNEEHAIFSSQMQCSPVTAPVASLAQPSPAKF